MFKKSRFDFTMGFGSLNMRLKELFLHTRIPFRDCLVVGLVHPPTMNSFAYGSLGQKVGANSSPQGILAYRKDSFSRVKTAKSHSKIKFSLFQT